MRELTVGALQPQLTALQQQLGASQAKLAAMDQREAALAAREIAIEASVQEAAAARATRKEPLGNEPGHDGHQQQQHAEFPHSAMVGLLA